MNGSVHTGNRIQVNSDQGVFRMSNYDRIKAAFIYASNVNYCLLCNNMIIRDRMHRSKVNDSAATCLNPTYF